MSKSNEHVLLVPGEIGWEIWTRQAAEPYSRVAISETTQAAAVEKIPHGPLTLLFPVKAATTIPMRVTSDDDALFADLAALHAERLGIKPDPMAGQLSDVFMIQREPENSAILAVFLRHPAEGELPARGPQAFDLSARAFPVQGNSLCIWKEFSRWVFASFFQGKLTYAQATACESPNPDASLAREIRIALIQLGLQGLPSHPSEILVWSEGDVDSTALSEHFHLPVRISPRPTPVLPDPASKLLPADVRAARRDAARRRTLTFAIGTAAAIYLGGVGWLAYGIWQTYQKADSLTTQATRIAPDADAFALHQSKWDELADAIQLRNSPVDILYRISTCIPPNSGLRLRRAEIEPNSIILIGEAPQPQPVKTFSRQLQQHNELTHFIWEKQEPTQKSRGWEFQYSASVPTAESQP